MNKTILLTFLTVCISLQTTGTPTRAATADATLGVTQTGKPVCQLTVIADEKSEALLKRAAGQVRDTVNAWGNVHLPLAIVQAADGKLPTEQGIVFTTLDMLKKPRL